MNVGVPKEIKDHEYRVAATPGGVRGLAEAHGLEATPLSALIPG